MFFTYLINLTHVKGGEYFKLVARQLKKKNAILHVDGDNETDISLGKKGVAEDEDVDEEEYS